MSTLKSHQSYKNSESWTDDLPVCKNTGIGFSMNQIYREDSNPQEDHSYEDCCCHFKFNDQFSWYAVFDGHEGKRAAEFCSQRMTAEIYFSQLTEKETDEEVKEFLRQSILTVEKGYMESLGDLLAERTSLQYDIPEGLSLYEVYQNVPELVKKINRLNSELASGTAAAVALIYKNKLYVANVGNCRVLLCQTDGNSVLNVLQLSVDHDLKNDDEILRLSQLGIDIEKIDHNLLLGNQRNTRCLGNYAIKGGYKDFQDLSEASQEPVIAEPDIHGGIDLDESCRFLLLMTAGLHKSVEEIMGIEQTNKYIAQCVVEQFRKQSTLTGVAQAAVDKIARRHHDWYMSKSETDTSTSKREDITLVLRNFNFPLPNAIRSSNDSVTATHDSLIIPNKSFDRPNFFTPTKFSSNNSSTNNSSIIRNPLRNNTGDSKSESDGDNALIDQKIVSYVDFSDFYRNLEIAREQGTLEINLL